MVRKQFVLLFEYFTNEHFGKDPFLVPYYIGKQLDYDVTIVFPDSDDNKKLPLVYKGVKLMRLPQMERHNSRKRYIEFYKYVWKNAKNIDILMRFFDKPLSRELSFLYKIRNNKGKSYIKMDVNPMSISNNKSTTLKSIFNSIKLNAINLFTKETVDMISCETLIAYNNIITSNNPWYKWGKKLVIMPNGFDEELFSSFHIKECLWGEKSNTMITVGRLGSYPKNTTMLLNALGKVDMRNWTFFLIGPIDDILKPVIKSFYIKNPEKKKSVVFMGPIYDKKKLWNIYNKSKVFVLSSEWESYGLVLVEAKRFRNYILTTPVGAAYDIIENGQYGEIIPKNDSDSLASRMQLIIDGKTSTDVYGSFDPLSVSYENMVKIITKRLS